MIFQTNVAELLEEPSKQTPDDTSQPVGQLELRTVGDQESRTLTVRHEPYEEVADLQAGDRVQIVHWQTGQGNVATALAQPSSTAAEPKAIGGRLTPFEKKQVAKLAAIEEELSQYIDDEDRLQSYTSTVYINLTD